MTIFIPFQSNTMKPLNCVRLACDECDRDDYDGITELMLSELYCYWHDIYEVQSYEDSVKVYDDDDEAPEWYSVLDWYTHLGTCPDCQGLEQ